MSMWLPRRHLADHARNPMLIDQAPVSKPSYATALASLRAKPVHRANMLSLAPHEVRVRISR